MIKNGASAPQFILERLDGARARFPEQYQGQVVVLRFWADWCPYCHSEMQALEPFYRQYRGQGLAILAINVMQPPETVRTFIEKLDISYEALLDRQGEVMRRYQVVGLPTTYLIDRKGVVRARIIGESTPEALTQALSGLL
ncbi:MAG: TlpA disulfide reductase family protein [Candidatus Competibacteraceae bacterium]